MVTRRHLYRLLGFALLLGLAYVGLAARLVVLQVVDHESYVRQADRTRTVRHQPWRGNILDANGNPLAATVPVKRVLANPRFIGPYYREVAQAIAQLVQYDTDELARLLRPVIRVTEEGRFRTNAYVDLKRKVSLDTWEEILVALRNMPPVSGEESAIRKADRRLFETLRSKAIYAQDDQQRVYPHGRLASHVLGFVQEELTNVNNMAMTELAGRYGIEHWFDAQLRGVPGWRVAETDPRRREIVIYRHQDVEAEPGLNLELTIDSVIQHILEVELAEAVRKHQPASASAMAIRPRTGEILGLAVLPNFDPNDPGKAKLENLRNRIIADTYEPGSTFKIVALSAALNERCVRLTDYINCENGLWMYAGRRLKDHGHYGSIPFEMVVSKSSNIGFAKVGLMLGEERLERYVRAFGFGARSEITLAGEVAASLPPRKVWDRLKITRIPIGQGVAVTHLQMAMAMCAVANEGCLMRPMLVRRLIAPNGEVFAEYQPQMVRQVVPPHVARLAVSALKTVVSTNGTAQKAILDLYTVAGKTGTAEKPSPRGGYSDEYVASFLGFLPADDPELCISVVLDQPDREKGYYGGQTAAPVFKAIAEQAAKYLKIRPDKTLPEQDSLPRPPTLEQVNMGSGPARQL